MRRYRPRQNDGSHKVVNKDIIITQNEIYKYTCYMAEICEITGFGKMYLMRKKADI